MIVMWFSRQREFRADAGGARPRRAPGDDRRARAPAAASRRRRCRTRWRPSASAAASGRPQAPVHDAPAARGAHRRAARLGRLTPAPRRRTAAALDACVKPRLASRRGFFFDPRSSAVPSMSTALVWFRRDLRLADNPALPPRSPCGADRRGLRARAGGRRRPAAPARPATGGCTTACARSRGLCDVAASRLTLRRGPAAQGTRSLGRRDDADTVYWNRALRSGARSSATRVFKADVSQRGLAGESFNGQPAVRAVGGDDAGGDPYRVFTPFWRACRSATRRHCPPRAAAGTEIWPASERRAACALGLPPSRPTGDAGLAPVGLRRGRGDHAPAGVPRRADWRAIRRGRDMP